MAKNENLHKAKEAKNDEFYTQYDEIQQELNHYEDKFKGKTVLCNCDDPFESNFCKFFLRNFNYLGLKRLICTSYNTSPVAWQKMTIWDYLGEKVAAGNGHGYVMDIKEVPMANGRGVSDEDIENLLKSKKRGVKKLKGDGDFRSDECIEYLKQADIIVTNPPFSLFRDYSDMKGLDWCHLYNEYHTNSYNSSVMTSEVKRLHEDDDVQKNKGIYEFLLCKDTDPFAGRLFDKREKMAAYSKQDGICPICGQYFEFEENGRRSY